MWKQVEQTDKYTQLMASYIRGHSSRHGVPVLEDAIREKPIEELNISDLEELFRAGKEAGLKLYRFKRTHEDLPRVRKVLGILKGLSFETLLDIGSGRGVFLFPFLSTFPWVSVTSADLLDYRVEFLQEIAQGGVERLTAVQADLCSQPFQDESFDIVTLLEVLEHIPDVERAVQAAVAMARSFVVVTVPSQPDNNPEHIHLLTKERLTQLFRSAGCKRLSFDGVNGHLIMLAAVSKK